MWHSEPQFEIFWKNLLYFDTTYATMWLHIFQNEKRMKDTPLKTHFNIQKKSQVWKYLSPFIFHQICFRIQISKFLLYSTNMAWIRLIFVVFCIGSIHGLPQDITNPCNDSKLCDLTKNLIENPSLVNSKPSDMVDIVIFALKMALEFISNLANCYFRRVFLLCQLWIVNYFVKS